MPNHAEQLAQELNLNVKNVQGAIELIDQGNTIPFIARYRKEATGGIDDATLRDLDERLTALEYMIIHNDLFTHVVDDDGNPILDDDGNAIIGDWKYKTA